jgi:8-oxo-dGTP pyrophosphatase MutT (NUDIX family)
VGDTKVVSDFDRYVTCPVLMMTKPSETEGKCFIFGRINPNRLNGSSINFVGGTLDKNHTAHSHPLEANFLEESEEEVGICPEQIEHWEFTYLVETEGIYFLVPAVYLNLTSTQMDEHFQRFTERDTEKEIIEIIKVPATPEGVLDFIHRNKNDLTRPMVDVLLVAVGLKKPIAITNAA